MGDLRVRDGVLQLRVPDTRWLSSGWDGGYRDADAAYNVAVPDGWDRTDVGVYARERREAAGFTAEGPALLTGVDLEHARAARLDDVTAAVTVGLSNPAALPMDPDGSPEDAPDDSPTPGTVNVVVSTPRALTDGALASLHGVAVEAKTATLLATAGYPGTTTDAVVVGSGRGDNPARFAGSATAVGAAARACVREAVRASFASRYADRPVPPSVDAADHGVVTSRRAQVVAPSTIGPDRSTNR